MGKLNIIKAEIQNDPASMGYAGKTASEKAILMNKLINSGATTVTSLTSKEIIDALSSAKIAAIQDSTETPGGVQNPGHNDAVRFDNYITAVGSIELATGTQGKVTLQALVTNGLIAQADLDNLVTLATKQVMTKRNEILGIGDVLQGEVEQALLLP